MDTKEKEIVVRSGLNFLRFVVGEYSRLEVYNNQGCDGEAKYSWTSDKKNPIQQSIADALMYIGFMKLV